MSGRELRQIGIGAAIIAASFIPGIGPVVSSALFSIGLSTAAGGLASAIAPDAMGNQGSALSMTLDGQAAVPVIYGETRVGLKLADIRVDTSSDNNELLVMVGALGVTRGASGVGTYEDVTEVYFGDRLAISSPTASSSYVTTGVQSPFNTDDRLRYSLSLGGVSTVAENKLTALFPTEWPSTSEGDKLAWIALFLKYDKDVYSGGIPNVTATVQGQKVYDPRDSSTAYSTNPALCIRDYLTSSEYGWGIPDAEIDDDSFEDAANYCDETVNTTGYNGTRFTCNVALDTNADRDRNLSILKACCRAELVHQGGKYRIIIREPKAAESFEITEDNIVGDVEWLRAGSDAPNSVTVRYVDPSQEYQVREVTWPEAGAANGFLTADNDFLSELFIDSPATQNYYIAQQLGMTTLRELREDITIGVTVKEEALKLQIGDVVQFTHETVGFDQKEFWVAGMGISPDATCRLILREYSSAAYTLDTQNTEPSVPGSELPDPFTVAAPTDLTVTSNAATAIPTQDGQYVPALAVAWTRSTHTFLLHYEVQYKLSADSDYTPWANAGRDDTATVISPVTDGSNYDVRIRAVSTTDVASEWTTVSSTTAGTQLPVGADALAVSLRETARTATTVTYTATFGASVGTWWVWRNTVTQPTASDPWPGASDPPDNIYTTSTTTLVVDVPDPGQVEYVEVVGFNAAATVSGTPVRLAVLPTLEPPDNLASATARVEDADGSVKVAVTADSRCASYRYAYNVGADPSVPSTATAESGTVETISGSDTFTLAADTVDYAETIRGVCIGYINANGTGTGSAADEHGEPVYFEAKRVSAPVGLELTSVDDTVDPAEVTVTVRDAGGNATALKKQTQVGDGGISAESTVTGSPVDGQTYTETVALQPKKQSSIVWHLDYTKDGDTLRVTLPVNGIDYGPDPQILGLSLSLNEGADTLDVDVSCDTDCASARCVASTSGEPSNATLDASSPVDGTGIISFASLLTGVTEGQTVYVKARAYSGASGAGEASGYVTKTAVYRVVAPSWENHDVSESGTTGTLSVDLVDASAQADAIYSQTKSGADSEGARTLVTGSPVDGATYSVNVTLAEGHPSNAKLIATYTLYGTTGETTAVSGPIDLGAIPDIKLTPILDESSGAVGYLLQGDSDTASYKLAYSTSSSPNAATVRGETAIDARNNNVFPLTTLTDGQTLYMAAFGYSATGGGGNESSEILLVDVTYNEIAGTITPTLDLDNSESGSTGTLQGTLSDPDGVADSITYEDSNGGSGTVSASPVDGNTYSRDVTLTKGEVDWIILYLNYTVDGEGMTDSYPSAGFDPDALPTLYSLEATVDASGAPSLDYRWDYDTSSIKVAASKVSTPTDGTVDGETAINASEGTYSPPITLAPGETCYFKIRGYSSSGGGGNPSTSYHTKQVTFTGTALLTECTIDAADGGAGNDVTWTATWGTTAAVNDTDFTVAVELYRDDSLVATATGFTPSDGTDTYVESGAGDGVADPIRAKFLLKQGATTVHTLWVGEDFLTEST